MDVALPGANPRTASALAEAAEVYEAAGRHTEAREKLETAVRLLALFFGDDAPSVQALHRKLEAVTTASQTLKQFGALQ